jgi:hypothetical protein
MPFRSGGRHAMSTRPQSSCDATGGERRVFASLCAAAARASPLQDGIASPAQATSREKSSAFTTPSFFFAIGIKGPPTGTGAAPAKTKGQRAARAGGPQVGGRGGWCLVYINCRLRLFLKRRFRPPPSVIPVPTLLSFLSLSPVPAPAVPEALDRAPLTWGRR